MLCLSKTAWFQCPPIPRKIECLCNLWNEVLSPVRMHEIKKWKFSLVLLSHISVTGRWTHETGPSFIWKTNKEPIIIKEAMRFSVNKPKREHLPRSNCEMNLINRLVPFAYGRYCLKKNCKAVDLTNRTYQTPSCSHVAPHWSRTHVTICFTSPAT